MSLFQTLVLLMFNEGDGFSFEEIKMATGIGKHPLLWVDVWCLRVFVPKTPICSRADADSVSAGHT